MRVLVDGRRTAKVLGWVGIQHVACAVVMYEDDNKFGTIMCSNLTAIGEDDELGNTRARVEPDNSGTNGQFNTRLSGGTSKLRRKET